jgi:hypothetical protein
MRILLFLICLISSRTQEAGLVPVEIPNPVIATPAPVLPHEVLLKTFVSNGLDTLTSKILVAQASFESGYFKNPLTKCSNNVFAILHNPYRVTLSTGDRGVAEGRSGYAEYKTLEDAAKDFIIFLEYRKLPKKLTSIDTYAYQLKQKRYYGSSAELYAKGVKVHFNHHFK